MPLKHKQIMVEDADGKMQIRDYWVREKPVNPYAQVEGNRLEQRNRKVRQFHHRKIRPDEKGYTWSMGYNHCSGRYSPGGKYSRFTGSSLNRNKQLNLFENAKDIPHPAGDHFAMALKIAEKYRRSGDVCPREVANFLMRQDRESEREFIEWVPSSEDRHIVGMGLPIHMLSPRSRGKIKDKATAFFRASSGDRVFCTLTFVDAVDDRTGVTILNKFLVSLRKTFKDLQFLWVAERQEKNVAFPGNIHFHMILNKRLPIRRWNALWIMQQYNAGLRGKNKYDETVSLAEIKQRFKDGTLHKVFNPLDVKKVKSIGGLSMYLTKYITKQKTGEPFGCAAWHCSRRVSRMFTRTTVGPSAFAYMRSLANFKVDKTTGECWLPDAVVKPFYILMYANDKAAPLKYLKEMEAINKMILGGYELDRLCLIDDDKYRSVFCKN